MSYVSTVRPRRARTARQIATLMPMVVGYGAFSVAFCFTCAVVLGLLP